MDKLTNSSALILPPPGTATNAVAEDIRGIKNPVAVPNGWAWVAWILGTAAFVALALYAWRRWKIRPQNVSPPVVIPPHERARRKLEEALGLLDQPKPFCIVVSDAVRLYLEERFNLHAPERTTDEFLAELQATSQLTPSQKDSLADFLSRCDLVKFARAEPPQTALQDLYAAALRLVDETEPKPETVAAGNGDAGQPPPISQTALPTPRC